MSALSRDCGVCGIPATYQAFVCDGYTVPRCPDHALMPPYQAESRLNEAINGCERVEREREEARQGEDELKAEYEGFKERLTSPDVLLTVYAGGPYGKLRDLADDGATPLTAELSEDVYRAVISEAIAASENPESTEEGTRG